MKLKLGRLYFGKHQGRLISDIAVKDPNYLHWLLEQDWLQKHLRVLICKALDIDVALLLQLESPTALPLKRYTRRIDRTTAQSTAQNTEPRGKG